MRARSLAVLAIGAGLLFSQSCALVSKTIETGGEEHLSAAPPPLPRQRKPHVLIFALDGACPAQLMEAIHSGRAPHVARLLGKDLGKGRFEHAYAASNATSVLPSSTVADWAAIFTGSKPAYDGVPGDEWFDRDKMHFYAPVPVSVHDLADNAKGVTHDLVGHQLKVDTLYEKLHLRSYVSLLSVYRGANIYTTVEPSALAEMMADLIAGKLAGESAPQSISASIDRDSAAKVVDALRENGVPDLQVVYFPGIDIYTHVSKNPLASQTRYLEDVTDPAVGIVLDEYVRQKALDQTYVIFISDHAHIPTMNDKRHELGTGDDRGSPFAAVAKAGFRVRPATLSNDDNDYQAVLAYQGFMAFIYLADRSTCPEKHQRCDWSKPPRLEEDVIPVLKTIYRSNQTGRPIAKLKGTIDLIFARPPMPQGEDALPFMVFDGTYLTPISEYLKMHPRPELIDLERRMNWLGAGPYGNRAGDIVLLARACTNLPIADRYYFAGVTHHTFHGSACEQDSHIPFVLANSRSSGEDLKGIVDDFGGDSLSERELTPIVEALLRR